MHPLPVGERNQTEQNQNALRDKLARTLEERADEVVAGYLAGIRSDGPNRAYGAADAWISRVHGRPKETVENVSAWDDRWTCRKMTREECDAPKREILRQHPELAAQYMAIRVVE